jgi:hypothetical protein
MMLDSIENSAPQTLSSRPLDAPRVLAQPPVQGGEQAAHKLRARGFSYRRIAEELRVRYDMVSQWLSGLPPASRAPAPSPSSVPRSEPQREERREQAAASGDNSRIAVLEQRLAEAFAALQLLAHEARAREVRLQAALAEERRVTAFQVERLSSDIAGLRAALAAPARPPSGAPAAAEAARAASSQGFWQRREH